MVKNQLLAGLLLLAAMSSCGPAPAAAPPAITTVAGGGNGEFSGDGGPATAAGLANPDAVAVDGQGDLFIADNQNHRIRRVAPDGTIATVAGSGPSDHVIAVGDIISGGGFSGDGGPATRAKLRRPSGIALDPQGDLFIADSGNDRIRKVTPDGTITTVAGIGPVGIGLDGRPVGSFSGDGGPATQAGLNDPFGVAVDAQGDLFIADTFNYRVRKVTPDGIITTVAGSGPVVVIPGDGALGGFAGDGGPATQAKLNVPSGLAVDLQGNLLIADDQNGRIRKVGADGIITTVAGTRMFGPPSGDGGPAAAAVLCEPMSVAVDVAGNLYVPDYGNSPGGDVRKIAADGIISTVVGNRFQVGLGDGGPATAASLRGPVDLAVDGAGNLFIADKDHERIREVMGVAAPGLLAGRPFPGAGPLPGDVNGDGHVTVADATLAFRIALGLLAPSSAQKAAADVSGDGNVTIADAVLILRRAIGL